MSGSREAKQSTVDTLIQNAENPNAILITGGAGFIGTHLCRELIRLGHKVVAYDLRHPKTPVEGVQYLLGDARNFSSVYDVVLQHGITTIYHLAATVSVPLCQKDPVESYSHNLLATQAVLEAARKCDWTVRVAFASSAALYGDLGNHMNALSEHTIASRFSSFYAAQKHASEKMIELYTEFYKVPTLMFRFFNVYGVGQDPTSPYSGVITIFSQLAKAKKPIRVYNSGIQTRDFIAVTELAAAIASAIALSDEHWDASVLNLGSGSRTTVKALAEMIRQLAGSDAPIVDAPPREGDVLHSLADIQKAKSLLKFNPTSELDLSALLSTSDTTREFRIDSLELS
jgi:UDP-glucose 4-epimerase